MKLVKLSITIPKLHYDFVLGRAITRAKRSGKRPNVSLEFQELVVEERERKAEKQPA